MTFRWIVTVEYIRGRVKFSEPWYVDDKPRDEALDEVKQDWYEINRHLFTQSVKFSIKEVGYE